MIPIKKSSARARLVFSDIDGTLVTNDKRLTAPVKTAVDDLRQAGLRFSVASARPPFGMRTVVEELRVSEVFAAFNGGMMMGPDFEILEQHLLPAALVQEVLGFFEAAGVEVWAFTSKEWLCRAPEGVYVDHEQHTIATGPTVVSDYAAYASQFGKLVAVSADFDNLAALEVAAQARFPDATVARSQKYYLDITHPLASKAHALEALARLTGVSTAEIVAVGDGHNDIGMLSASGFGIGMGNGPPDVHAAADLVVGSNEADGFVEAAAYVLAHRAKG